MLMRPIAVVGLVAGVIVAAGAGAYVAVRQNAAVPPPLVEVVAADATQEPAGPEFVPAVEATEALVDTLEPTVFEVPPAPAPVQATRREAPDAARPPTPSPTSPPTTVPEQARTPAGESPRAVFDSATEPAAETVTEVTPAEPAPVQTVRADLPAIDGWTRPEPTEPLPATVFESNETALPIPDIAAPSEPDPQPPVPAFVEFEIAADSVIGIQVDTAVSTRTAQVEDTVEARVTRDVTVGDQVAIPAGTRMVGSVVLVETGGKLRDAARLGVRFHTLVMDDGVRVQAVTETIYREGRSRGSDSVAKIGGAAVGGAILGAIFGGSRGAAIGGSIGAAGGTAAALNGEPEPARLPPGARLTVRLSRPVTVTVER